MALTGARQGNCRCGYIAACEKVFQRGSRADRRGAYARKVMAILCKRWDSADVRKYWGTRRIKVVPGRKKNVVAICMFLKKVGLFFQRAEAEIDGNERKTIHFRAKVRALALRMLEVLMSNLVPVAKRKARHIKTIIVDQLERIAGYEDIAILKVTVGNTFFPQKAFESTKCSQNFIDPGFVPIMLFYPYAERLTRQTPSNKSARQSASRAPILFQGPATLRNAWRF